MSAKLLFRVHSWIGVIAGLLLFVICWSGTFAVVSNEVDWLLDPAQRVQLGARPVSWGTLEQSVLAAYPGGAISFFEAPRHAGAAAVVVVDLPSQDALRVYVDPYSGAVQGESSYFNVQRFFRSFHMNLFAGRIGSYVVFVFSLFLLASVLLPFFFYKRWWRGFFALKRDRGRRVFWSDLHKLAGLWSALFALIIALTGVWYLAEGLRGDFGDRNYAWTAVEEGAINILPPITPLASQELPLDALVERAKAARPDLEIRGVWRDGGYLYVDGQSGDVLVRDRANKLYLDPRDGRIVYSQRADEQPLWWRLSDTADPLHFGNFAGLASKLLWFVFGLGLSALALTGAWLHVQRLQRDGARRAAWPGARLALVATGLVLCVSAAGGVQEILSYGPHLDGEAQWPQVPLAVGAFICAWILLTLLVLAAWGDQLGRALGRGAPLAPQSEAQARGSVTPAEDAPGA